ncbi:MAG TPA: TetR/AcrR family transcriptional regulator [Luteibaculaceae bacterium]|nr:TetR/AcrR family transcriptional regulator [Luteibaculaceae bacterium]
MGRKPTGKARSGNEVKREKWIHLCMDYFSEKGISDITMEDVAQVLNISKATIYNHFKSKDEMVMTAIGIKLREIGAYEDYFSNRDLGFFDRYYLGMRFYATKMGAVSTVLVRDVKNQFPDLWRIVEMFRERFNFIVGQYYQEGMDLGHFHPDLNIKMLTATDRWFLESLIEKDFLQKSEMTVEQAFDAYFKVKFEGIVRSKVLTYKPTAFGVYLSE